MTDKPALDHSQVLRQFPYGLYLVGSSRDGHSLVILANWVTQVSFSPPLVVVSIELDSKIHDFVVDSRYFSVNVLPSGRAELARSFIKSDEMRDGMINGHRVQMSRHGSPCIEEASGWVECRVNARHEAGDHALFVGQVVHSHVNFDGPGITLRESGLSYRKKSI